MARGEERSAARLAAVQALYEMEMSGKGVNDALAEFQSHWLGKQVEGVDYKPAEESFFRDLVSGVIADQHAVDQRVDAALAKGWPLRRIEAVLRAILRAGVYELVNRKDVPAKVVISEYVDVTSAFYEGDEPGMVNAVLDSVGRQTRTDELGQRTR
jgi:transcription antitermination protein NusB